MSDNTFWLGFWFIVLAAFVALMSFVWFAVKNQKEAEKAMYDKCITEKMQYVNGNCLYGRGN